MRVLIIDCHRDPESFGAKELMSFQSVLPGSIFYVRRAPDRDLPKTIQKYDRIVVSGSRTSVFSDEEWIGSLVQFLKSAMDSGKPILGVCYGHQVLAQTLLGRETLRKSQNPEYGWTEILKENPSRLFKDLPDRFYSFSYHGEEVGEIPQNMRVIARSKDCAIQAFEATDKPIFGIQFHPEKNPEDAKKSFATLRKERIKTKTLKENEGNHLYSPRVGEIIFRNFFEIQ